MLMVIAKLFGGLGNQMFQYAAAMRLAQKHGVELLLDIEAYKDDKLRNYGLDNWCISGRALTKQEANMYKGNTYGHSLRLIAWSRNILRQSQGRPTFFKEKNYRFDPALLNASKNVYIDGYWQSYKYFEEISDLIRDQFTPKQPLPADLRQLEYHISQTTSVSLHIRRGDYASDSVTNHYHGLCSIDYYRSCLRDLSSRLNSVPNVFIFTDDVKWVTENLKLELPTTYVSGREVICDHQELYLMSRCKHNIIANSTFSWWAAWLNPNPQKLVYAPRIWFAVPRGKVTDDLIPDTWFRL